MSLSNKKSTSDLVDSHVSLEQCRKAVSALCNHALSIQRKKQETELLPGREDNIWLVLAVKQVQPEKKLKPRKIPIVHPLVDPRTTPICLITKDPQREYKDLLEAHKIKFISRVVGIEKLKGKFKPFEARRMLLKENGLFLADERVTPMLPGLLGKIFFKAKKQPIPVCLTRKDLKSELERSISSTYMHQNQGACTSVKIGVITQTPNQILDNLQAALPVIVKNIKGGWDNIQSFNVKTSTSTSLPIWSCELGRGDGARWPDLVEEESWTGLGEGDADGTGSDVDEELTKNGEGRKKKRKAASVEELKKPKQSGQLDSSAQNTRQNKKSKTSIENVSPLVDSKIGDVVRLKSPAVSSQEKGNSHLSASTTHTDGELADDEMTTNAENLKVKKKQKKSRPTDSSPSQDAESNANTSNSKETETLANKTDKTKSGELNKKEMKLKNAQMSSAKKDKVVKEKLGGKRVKDSLIGSKAKSRI